MIERALYSSARMDWGTPPELFAALDREFGFTLDAAANERNAKCAKFFTPETDGLKQSWKTDGAVWCNPPYGKEIEKWVRKAFVDSGGGQTVVMLIPARTDTKWFHRWVYGKAEIRFLRGRLKYRNADGAEENRAPFPSMVVIYRGRTDEDRVD